MIMRRQSTLNQSQNCPTFGVHLSGGGINHKDPTSLLDKYQNKEILI